MCSVQWYAVQCPYLGLLPHHLLVCLQLRVEVVQRRLQLLQRLGFHRFEPVENENENEKVENVENAG